MRDTVSSVATQRKRRVHQRVVGIDVDVNSF
jgi:hypothetical protein